MNLPKENTFRPDAKNDRFNICIDAMKDYSAHYKFMKKSGLRFRGETRRSDLPKGPEGWKMWQTQFTPQEGQDTTIIENALDNLCSQGKLKESEGNRLRKLYGLSEQKDEQISVPNVKIPPTPIPEPPIPTNTCPRCGAPLRWIQQYQRWYCDQEKTFV